MKRKRPKLGQHFLSSIPHQREIIAALPIRSEDLVIEVGPGKGAVTGLLAERARQVVAVEVDTVLAQRLERLLSGFKNLQIQRQDILETDIAEICKGHGAEKCFLFGNLPYHITSPFLRHAFGSVERLRGMGLLLQLEVAERITSAPGPKAYGFLSVLSQYYSQPQILRYVPPGAFTPPPKVQSALVGFDFPGKRSELEVPGDEAFLRFVLAGFQEKRKTLSNNLIKRYPGRDFPALLSASGLDRRVRAEQMSLEQFAALHRRLSLDG